MIGGTDSRTSWFKRPSFAEMNSTIWKRGGRWARAFLAFGYFTAVFLAVLVLLMLWWFLRGALQVEVLLSFGLAALTYGAFHGALSTGVISAGVWKHYLDEGRLHPHEDYFREWIRILENEGNHGLFPGAIPWSIALWAVYYGSLLIAVLFTLAFQPTFREGTPILFASLDSIVVSSSFIAWRRHLHRVERRLAQSGYRLEEYARAAGWMPPPSPVNARRLIPKSQREMLMLLVALLVLLLAIFLAYGIIAGWIQFNPHAP